MKKYLLTIVSLVSCFTVEAQWTVLNSGTTHNLTDVIFLNADVVFAAGDILLKTTNGGISWDIIDYGLTNKVYGVSFPSENNHVCF